MKFQADACAMPVSRRTTLLARLVRTQIFDAKISIWISE
jgi:hypothetical protein